ncbi:MAG: tetratricopeptide repeat protein [Acidimicrobiia bacterium]|nr:tetratricopeptide repeat protein [Acidimicrobiia bacterium]
MRAEIQRLAGARAEPLHRRLIDAADAFAHDRVRDAIRILRPLRDELPDAASVRELLGLALYRAGRYGPAAKELQAFDDLSGSVEQHPVLMDCHRALGHYAEVERLWAELGEVSPGPELVAEGRIVAAGALADQGRVAEAIRMLDRRAGAEVRRAKEHHLRLWYALADLEERAGNLPRARLLFERVRAHAPDFADVAERLAALG